MSKETNFDLYDINNNFPKYPFDKTHRPVYHLLHAENNTIIQRKVDKKKKKKLMNE
jgi:hypothetical protein